MEKIHASLVLEILGRPKEHVKEALNTLVIKMGSDKGVKLLNKSYHEPVPVEDSKDLFTAFAEVTVELDTLANYIGIIFAYMPSHIEIIKPENLSVNKAELNELANVLAQRLHNYDAVTKQMIAERDTVLKKLYEIAPHLFKQPEQPQQQAPRSESKKSKASNKLKKRKK